MRKNATKIAAMMLSLALTVTSVNVPTTASAAAKVKLNKTKATLYVGGASSKKTTTLKATLNGKKVKATFTSSNAKVAKVAKSTGKVTAVKKGTATITAKYSGKKATCKVTVKQFVTGITAPETIELKEGEQINLSEQVTVSPANANNKELSYVPGESYIAGVKKDGTVLKGVKEGQTLVVIKAKDGSGKSATVKVNVKAADAPATDDPGTTDTPVTSDKEAKNVKIGIENPFDAEKYPDTVLIGTNAYVTVQLTDEDGKPVANKEVELTAKRVLPSGAMSADQEKRISMFGNVSESVKKTDSKGNVTFVYGLDKTTDPVDGKVIDATNTNFLSSFKLTASVVDNKTVKESVDVKFASLAGNGVASVRVLNGVANTPYVNNGLVHGVNATYTTSTTQGRNKEGIQYVSSQQVSKAGGDAHKVVFDSGLGALTLTVPGAEQSGSEAERVIENVNWSTDKYLTYAAGNSTDKTGGGWVLKGAQTTDLQYATVTFNKLRLSKYTQFLVRAYIVNDKDNPNLATAIPIALKASESNISGPRAEDNFSVQIPVDGAKGYLYVTAQVISRGQVNTDLNDGFEIKNIEGVKKPGSAGISSNATSSVSGLEVKWDVDTNATYTINQKFDNTSAEVANLYAELTNPGTLNYSSTNNTFWYKVPAFPATGNAIITVRDNAGNDIAYYAVPTTNPDTVIGGNTVAKNQNQIVDNVALMYQISKEEATQINDTEKCTVTQDGNNVIVNNEKSGVIHLVGTITSTNDSIKIDESNSRIYTSIHWNPVKNETANTSASGVAAAALVGQNLVLRAQLTDNNGNAVTTPNISVKFYKTNTGAADVEILATDTAVGEASLVKMDTKTNSLGQAELVLNSGAPAQTLNIVAKVGNGTDFNITYKVGTETVTGAWVDLYWVDANIYFEPGYGESPSKIETTLAAPVKEVKSEYNINPTVGENWAYEVRTNGQTRVGGNQGTLNGYNTVNISGLTVQTSVAAGSVGSVTNAENGKAQATSTKAGYTDIVNELNNNSVTKDVKLTFVNAANQSKDVPYAGEGPATLNKKLTLNVNWGHSVPTVGFIIPTGSRASVANADIKVYVEVKDANGNPIDDRAVTLKNATAGKGTVTGTSVVDGNAVANTNAEGIAEFTIGNNSLSAGDITTLVATVDGLTSITQTNINWVAAPSALEVKYAEYKPEDNTITLTFNTNVSAASVVKDVFNVQYNADGDDGTYERLIVKETKVSGKEVVLTLGTNPNAKYGSLFKVTMEAYTDTKTGITYKVVGVDANALAAYPTTTPTFEAGAGKKEF